MSDHPPRNRYIELLQQFSIPLILGVIVALIICNIDNGFYDRVVHHTYSFFITEDHAPLDHTAHDSHEGQDTSHEQHVPSDNSGDHPQHGNHGAVDSHAGFDWLHYATLHFWVNEIFMVLFFGIAAKEITESCLPGGALNPVRKAINPLLGTIGGVVGPVGTYFLLNALIGQSEWKNGWGIPTATDIALAWLVAKMVFGVGHPAISFLLLLAVADDGIGLAIIAFAYPDPNHPTVWSNALWIIPGMAIAYGLRRFNVRSWLPYILLGGGFSWFGLYSAHLHPALALVPIVPFLPGPKRDAGLYLEPPVENQVSPLEKFEHDLKLFVDFGLFFFAFANAGVPFSNINNLTWIVLFSLIIGKTVGITLFSSLGILLGFPLPDRMKVKHLVVAGIVAGLGLTVALFVSGEAFTEAGPQGAAKMGALFSAGAGLLAIIVGRIVGVKDACPPSN
ncbi:MAG TPA: Na+/H+ antiporter NhaA [Pirellulaceae bacterium]|nr:Na+/H+ antiporter NhaA [Pirellulaceae bacterium]HMO93825.1 Na+/H+ antiporter NhaA [Pirellulaceae bacterium]HMP70684.1 Na+/H+ antiporter NhaA [Pirellulaceae bacterium]